MSVINVIGASKKHNVMQDTWGHLYPQPSSKHAGFIILVVGDDNSTTIVKSVFETLECSPMRCELESTALGLYNYTELGCKVWRLDCTLWFYKSSGDMYRGGEIGKIIKPKLTMLLDLDKVKQNAKTQFRRNESYNHWLRLCS